MGVKVLLLRYPVKYGVVGGDVGRPLGRKAHRTALIYLP